MAEGETTEASEEEKMAEEWEAAAASEEGGEDGGRALSQSEIDNLLGFEEGEDNKTGIEALLDRAMLSFDRLPMLEVVFDRFVRNLSTTLRNFTSDSVDVSIDSINSMRFEDYLNSIPLPALLTVFQAVEWENYGLINVDSSLTFSLVDVLLGGGRVKRPVRIEGRPYTTIEQDIVKTVTIYMLDDMSAAFNPLTPATFRFERMENNPRFATITRPANPVILVSLRIDMEERGGKAEIMLPYATIEPIKDLLTQMFTGESFGKDTQWESNFLDGLSQVALDFDAVMDRKTFMLKDIAKLKVGSTLIMDKGPKDPVDIYCEGEPIIRGKMGCVGNNIAVKVEKLLSNESDDNLT